MRGGDRRLTGPEQNHSEVYLRLSKVGVEGDGPLKRAAGRFDVTKGVERLAEGVLRLGESGRNRTASVNCAIDSERSPSSISTLPNSSRASGSDGWALTISYRRRMASGR